MLGSANHELADEGSRRNQREFCFWSGRWESNARPKLGKILLQFRARLLNPPLNPIGARIFTACLELLYESYAVSMRHEFDSPTFSSATSLRVSKAFIPIYPNRLPTVPKPSRSRRTASLAFNHLPASRSAITVC